MFGRSPLPKAKTDSVIAKDSNLAAIVAEVEKLSAEITTAIKADISRQMINDIEGRRPSTLLTIVPYTTSFSTMGTGSPASRPATAVMCVQSGLSISATIFGQLPMI